MSLKVGENVAWVSNSLDLGETPSYSASHLDPSCLPMARTLIVIGRLGVKHLMGQVLHLKHVDLIVDWKRKS